MMPKIFISYRRADSENTMWRINDHLEHEFDSESIFIDVDKLPAGKDFREELQKALALADVVLVIIGKIWLTVTGDDGKRRLDDEGDFVRMEVEMALQRENCLVIPVVVNGATMPNPNELPVPLRPIQYRNAVFIAESNHLKRDVKKLIQEIKKHINNDNNQYTSSPIDIDATFDLYKENRDAKQWYEARRLADLIRSSPDLGDYPVIHAILESQKSDIDDAISSEEALQYQREFESKRLKQYKTLREYINDKKLFRTAYQSFIAKYPDYDPDPLGHFASRAYDLLPQPFEWVPIPAGKVTIGYGDWENGQYVVKRTQDFHIESYAIAKYPVTNAQYEVFVKHPDGYKNPKWWDYSDEAKQWRAGRPDMEKSYFDGGDCPRETISWYDSVAFCLWLSAMTGDNISLPTEQQWQRAAIGDTQNVYPWGDEIDETYANYVGRTTPVTQYPKGASPYGVMDMSGNVLEWCLTEYESGDIKLTGNSARVLRGGSWDDNLTDVRSVDRDGDFPSNRGSLVGLRCVRSHLLF